VNGERQTVNAERRTVTMEPDHPKDLEVEIELLQRIGHGDRGSFEELYDRLAGALFATAFRVLNNRAAAEDVLQEAFLQIWEKAPLYNPALGKPLAWAVTLTRYKAIDRLRSTQRRNRLQDSVQRESESFAQFDARDAFDAVVSAETSQLVIEAMAKLSEDQRQVMELAFFASMTQTEIAEYLKQPLGTIKARIRRGMMKLRDLINPAL
jgi:RNA polymerase sigma-70 factor (ECF subfamily)